jgi:hypothetical protein
MPHPAEVNRLELDGMPPYVLKAIQEEQERWHNEFRAWGPHVVGLDTLKPRLRAAAEQAIREHEQDSLNVPNP